MNYLIDFIDSTYHFFVNSWGLTIALVGYIVQKFFIPQILEYREILKRARYNVIYYGNIFPFFDKNDQIINENDLNDAHKELRVIASRIRAHRDNIPCYKQVSYTGLVPTYENTELAAIHFFGWSNEIFEKNSVAHARQKRRRIIAKALGMKYI